MELTDTGYAVLYELGDDADNPRYIITEPRVGYRMAVGETPAV